MKTPQMTEYAEGMKPGEVKDGHKFTYGCPKKVAEILGAVLKTVPPSMLDGMGTFEARELREERYHLRSIGAIKF